ncbi:hypothetical protein Ciccas_005886 [Cichlidogyrus casuarinus]|uniref:Uncharacterized protein n=1 Tax=Cichlidogyrus casuarinus TaxID=1844966 RepID=A0ABD2Q7V2_9PLAT
MTWSRTVTTWISYQFRDGPSPITYYWPALPSYINYIDGGLEREDGLIYLFKDARFWLLVHNIKLQNGFRKDGMPLQSLGLPKNLRKIDTIFRWAENKAVYIFAGDWYWKLDETEGPYGRVEPEPNYPRRIKDTWMGIPTPVRAAFTQLNGDTLFFQGNNYWEFDNIAMKSREGFPKQANLHILGCFDETINNKE